MSPEQQANRLIKDAENKGVLRLHQTDFDCLNCGRSFDFARTKKLSPTTFVLAHLKSCVMVNHGATPPVRPP